MRWIILVLALVTVAPSEEMAAETSTTDDTTHPAKVDEEGTIEIFKPSRVLEPEVTFLPGAPRIDGRLDEQLESLPVREFSRVWKSDPDNPVIPAHYRLGYGTDFLYVYVEAEAEGLSYRDRAFQNGDGFSLVIARPRPDDEPTEEFYVLSCSAVNEPDLEWTRRVFWYYNVYDIFVPTSEKAELEFREGDEVISFELYLPWSDVQPYHPWISDSIGFNLRFVKAIGGRQLNRYKVFPGTIGRENSPRWYGYLEFQRPVSVRGPQTFVGLDRRNAEEGTPVHAIAVTVAPEGAMELVTVSAKGEEGNVFRQSSREYECEEGITRHDFEVVSADVPQGDYIIEWRSKQDSGGTEVTVLPTFDHEKVENRLARVKNDIPQGSFTTLEYKVQRLENLLMDLRTYEVASYERATFLVVEDQLSKAERGIDPYAGVTNPLRRAFRSKLDDALQPYVVLVPKDYDPSREYPLLVFLHGSASTETDILGHDYAYTEDFIAMAPYGRGRSNGFATDEAQTDIAEAIDDVISNYSIDSANVVLTGFSMGGYGVYRTYRETPAKFKALAVFSGGTKFGGEGLDFLTEKLESFAGKPIFIYHGELDRNVSYRDALEMVERLREAGARVEFRSDSDRGHQRPSDATIKAYRQWLRSVIDS